jgi:ABC-type uncharacterized transport system permease subunit
MAAFRTQAVNGAGNSDLRRLGSSAHRLGSLSFRWVQALQLRLQAIGLALPTYLLMMAPYAFTIVVLIIASASRARRRLGAPTALGTPYIRGA